MLYVPPLSTSSNQKIPTVIFSITTNCTNQVKYSNVKLAYQFSRWRMANETVIYHSNNVAQTITRKRSRHDSASFDIARDLGGNASDWPARQNGVARAAHVIVSSNQMTGFRSFSNANVNSTGQNCNGGQICIFMYCAVFVAFAMFDQISLLPIFSI